MMWECLILDAEGNISAIIGTGTQQWATTQAWLRNELIRAGPMVFIRTAVARPCPPVKWSRW